MQSASTECILEQNVLILPQKIDEAFGTLFDQLLLIVRASDAHIWPLDIVTQILSWILLATEMQLSHVWRLMLLT